MNQTKFESLLHRFSRHIALLLLLLLSVFTFPKALWHHHEPVKTTHQDCEHASHLEDEALDCTLCQLHTPTFFPEAGFRGFAILPLLDLLECENPEVFLQNTSALPFLRGPPAFS